MKRSIGIALLAVLLLAGCVKTKYTPLNAQDFTKKAERSGAVTQAASDGDAFSADHPESLVARVFFANSDKGWSGAFWEFDSDAAAAACFSRLFAAYQPMQTFSPGDEYARFEVTLDDGAQPIVKVVRVRGTVLLLSCADNEISRDAAAKLLVTLRYN